MVYVTATDGVVVPGILSFRGGHRQMAGWGYILKHQDKITAYECRSTVP